MAKVESIKLVYTAYGEDTSGRMRGHFDCVDIGEVTDSSHGNEEHDTTLLCTLRCEAYEAEKVAFNSITSNNSITSSVPQKRKVSLSNSPFSLSDSILSFSRKTRKTSENGKLWNIKQVSRISNKNEELSDTVVNWDEKHCGGSLCYGTKTCSADICTCKKKPKYNMVLLHRLLKIAIMNLNCSPDVPYQSKSWYHSLSDMYDERHQYDVINDKRFFIKIQWSRVDELMNDDKIINKRNKPFTEDLRKLKYYVIINRKKNLAMIRLQQIQVIQVVYIIYIEYNCCV
jgi:hypothetical protein